MSLRCPCCAGPAPDAARFCPRCGVAVRRRGSGRLTALAFLLGAMLILLSNMTMRAVHTAPATAVVEYAVPTPRLPPAPGPVLDVERNPAVLLDRAIPVTDLRLHAVRLGDTRDRIAPANIIASGRREVRCYDGNAYLCAGRTVQRIVLNDPAILSRLPVRECLALFRRLGTPELVEHQRQDDRILFIYPSRGLTVRWHRRTARIDQVILHEPAPPRPNP